MILYTLNHTFPPATRTVGYIAFFAGLLAALYTPVFGLVMMAGAAFVAYAKNMIELDPTKKRYRLFTSVLGIKMGKWLPLEGFPFITMMKKRVVTTTYSRANTPATTDDDNFFGLYLLNKSHRKKILVARFERQEEAKAHIDRLTTELEITYVKYAPSLSAASQKRARARR